jgi:hypothetical protein
MHTLVKSPTTSTCEATPLSLPDFVKVLLKHVLE